MKNYIKYFFLGLVTLYTISDINGQTVGGTTSGATSYCSTTNVGYVSLSGHNGTILAWQVSTNGGLNWINTGITTINQTYFNLNQTSCYRAVVQDGSFPADTSTIVCIDIYPPTLAGTLSGGGIFCGSNASGQLTLTGYTGSIMYWESSINGGTTWTTIGNNNDTEDISSVTQTTQYRVTIQSGTCSTETSNIVTVTVTPETVTGNITGPTSVCSGTNSGTLTLTGHTGSILNWIKSTNNGTTWSSLGTTITNYNFTNITQTTWFRTIVQNGTCSIDSTSNHIITVDPLTIPGEISGGNSFCGSTGSGTLSLTGYTGLIVNWEYSINSGTTWVNIANTTATEIYTNLTQTTLYRANIQSGSCSLETTNIDTVFVTPQTVSGNITGPTSVCSGSNSGILSLTGHTGSIIDWILSTNNGTTWISLGNTLTNYNFTNINQTSWYRAIIQSGNCNIDSTGTHIITIDPTTAQGTMSGGNVFCGTTGSGSLIISGYTGNIVNWESSINGGSTWQTISNTTDTEIYINLTQTTLYRANVQSGNCTMETTNTDTIFVTPQTVVGTLSSDASICPLINQTDITLAGHVGDILYWLNSTDGGITWVIDPITSNPLTIINLNQTSQYQAVIQSGRCDIDTSNTVTLTVHPINIISAGNDTTIIIGESTILNGSGIGIPSWDPIEDLDDYLILTPLATPLITTTYVLSITDNNSCFNTDTVIVTIEDTNTIGIEITITNLFTPNGDGYNDYWYIKNIENNTGNEVFVYNIYGQLVFSTKDYNNDWDGTYQGGSLPDGTYYYIIKLMNSDKPLKGSLDILR